MACGKSLTPLPIQRWRCPVHGTHTFLPAFLARRLRYLAEVVGTVLKRMVTNKARVQFPPEISGPEPDTARRWFKHLLLEPGLKRWLYDRLGTSPLPDPGGPGEIIDLAMTYARRISLDPRFFSRILQSVRIALAN